MDASPSQGSPAIPAVAARASSVWGQLALVSGAFCVCVAAALVVGQIRFTAGNPLESRQLTRLKEDLRQKPRDDALKLEIRRLDQELRRRYFEQVRRNQSAGWLLLGGAAVFLWVSLRAVALRRRAWLPALPKDDEAQVLRDRRWARAAVLAAGGGVALAMAVLAVASRPRVPESLEALARLNAPTSGAAEAPAAPSLEESLRQWPRFRGALGDGVVRGTNTPVAWDGATSEGVVWKVPVTRPGFGSPVVWGPRLFLTGGDEKSRDFLCYSTETGELLWQTSLPALPAGTKLPEIPEGTGWAASTPATDGERVYGMFATGELAACDASGKLIWHTSLGAPENMYGYASSLAVWGGRLIVQNDQGEPEAGRSRLYAFDGRTGRKVWDQRRQVPSSWTTPLVLPGEPAQIIAMGEPWVIAYDWRTGSEIWRVECLGTDLAPSPVAGAGLLFVPSPSRRLVAMRWDGQGNVTKTHVAWTAEENVPDITSPLFDGERVYTLMTDGLLTCLDAKTGAKLYEKALGLEFNASPTLADGALYLMATTGETLRVAAGTTFQELGRCALPDTVHASPAIAGGRIYVRGKEHLWALGPRNGAAPH